MHRTDVVVVGGGVAGAAAALSAAAAGARTILVRSGPGATAGSTGGWRGEPPPALRAALADAGLVLQDCSGRLPHPDGRLVAYDAAPRAQAQAALNGDAEGVLVCGISGLGTFRPAAVAALWSSAAGLPAGALEGLELSVEGTPEAGWSPVALAAHVERHPALLGEPLSRAVRERGAARAVLPAVLGVERHDEVHAALTAAAGVVVGEALGAAPSLPGWRVDRALLRALEAAGVPVVTGIVTDHVARRGRIRFITVADQRDAMAIRASAVVLATGKFLGGGVSGDSRLLETALRLGLTLERGGRSHTDAADSLSLTNAAWTEAQPVLSTGVRTNGENIPVTESGDVVFHNVVVAGSVRAGTETASLGLGNAARDGWEAGERAARLAAST
jgi:glycerol-3-phosphate dehydrogenase subunit B